MGTYGHFNSHSHAHYSVYYIPQVLLLMIFGNTVIAGEVNKAEIYSALW